MPDLALERDLGGVVAGIDEAGRGPWAGPVIAAAVILDEARLPAELQAEIDDSKQLTAKQRQTTFEELRRTARFGVGQADVAEIDVFNILRASQMAMARALSALGLSPDAALVDGNQPPILPCPVTCVVGGDGLSLSIAAASIVAKVSRDRIMTTLASAYPGYGWDHNFGYGTAEHRDALKRLGVTPHHRRSFRPIQDALKESYESKA